MTGEGELTGEALSWAEVDVLSWVGRYRYDLATGSPVTGPVGLTIEARMAIVDQLLARGLIEHHDGPWTGLPMTQYRRTESGDAEMARFFGEEERQE